jgi:S-adenosylmethionine hydrolase
VNVITLVTDFGAKDWFVGTMKGVLLRAARRANIVDITHEIPAGEIRTGAFALAASCRFFPKGTVHVAVVDPGVGSARRPIAVQTTDYYFVGPDNGVLSLALVHETIKQVRVLESAKYFLQPVSRTFHGRDIFAPVAAQLSNGLSMQKLGRTVKDFTQLTWPEVKRTAHTIAGEILYLDRFGNAITNVERAALSDLELTQCTVSGRGQWRCPVGAFYQGVPRGQPVALIGSTGRLEIAVNGGSAAKQLHLRIGDRVVLRRRNP